MRDEKLRQQYRDEGWGRLAEEAGFDPVNTESSAREAFWYCQMRIEKLETTIASALEEMERPHYGDRDHQLDNFLEAMDTLKRAL